MMSMQRDAVSFVPPLQTEIPKLTAVSAASELTSTGTYVYDPGGNRFVISGKNCEFQDVNLGQRIMSENESQSLVINFTNEGGTTTCELTIEIQAPGFDIQPVETKQVISLTPNIKSTNAVWTLLPKKLGNFEVSIKVSDGTVATLGVTVTNVFGLNISVVSFLSWFGAILGPMLSLPWWYEKFHDRYKSKSTTSNLTSRSKPK